MECRTTKGWIFGTLLYFIKYMFDSLLSSESGILFLYTVRSYETLFAIHIVIWVVIPSSLVGIYECFRRTYYIHPWVICYLDIAVTWRTKIWIFTTMKTSKLTLKIMFMTQLLIVTKLDIECPGMERGAQAYHLLSI